jgi:thiol-disulfide isomerase/thioredoxin
MGGRWRVGIAVALFVAATAVVTWRAHYLEKSLEGRRESKTSVLRGKAAPEFSLPLLTPSGGALGTSPAGQPAPAAELALADYRGQIVLISFWASWCKPCDYELPLLNQYYLSHREQGIQVIAISTDSDRAAAQKYADDRQYAMPMVWDAGGRVADLYKADVLPTLIVIDAAGRVREVEHGARMDLESWLDRQVRLLAAKKPDEKKAS